MDDVRDGRDVRWTAALAHRERLLRIARARLGPAGDAEDVVQEALLRCVEHAGLDLARIGPFLTSVTVRLCADVHRRAQEPDRAKRWLAPMLEDAPDPADLVCRDVEAGVVASLVAELPERQRRVLVDRASGLSIPQISARQQLTYKSVESALSRARSAMRAAVGAALALGALFARNRRTAAIVALPATAVTLVALVLVTPHSDREAEAVEPPARVPFVAETRPRQPAAERPPRAGDTGSVVAVRRVPVPRPEVGVVPPSPPKPLVGGRNDALWVDPDNDDDDHVERVLDCANFGPDLVVRPGEPYAGFECRRAPAEGPPST